jgi:hypothetical protein
MTKSSSPVDAIKAAVEDVTKDWAKQRKAEERGRRSSNTRLYHLLRTREISIKDVAYEIMEEAYMAASDNGQLPAKPRQIMYAARPEILRRTGKDHLSDAYFTQTLLPDFIEEYGRDDWDVVWDARGTFSEPHTAVTVPIGTLEVRQYLGDRPAFGGKGDVDVADNSRFPTIGPENRYGAVLYIEKEGFAPLFSAVQLAARFDLAIASNKGMSVTATRMLLDRLVTRGVDKIFVLHDFDISGFSIVGTIGTDSRRYIFDNEVPIIDLGLRLEDVEAMGLQSEPVPPSRNDWRRVSQTLQQHGATPAEIAFLRARRVELNAMTSRQFIDFLEGKFEEHGVKKVVPDDEVIRRHARRVVEQRLAEEAIKKIRGQIAQEAVEVKLPEDLRDKVEAELEGHPELPWDAAVAAVLSTA